MVAHARGNNPLIDLGGAIDTAMMHWAAFEYLYGLASDTSTVQDDACNDMVLGGLPARKAYVWKSRTDPMSCALIAARPNSARSAKMAHFRPRLHPCPLKHENCLNVGSPSLVTMHGTRRYAWAPVPEAMRRIILRLPPNFPCEPPLPPSRGNGNLTSPHESGCSRDHERRCKTRFFAHGKSIGNSCIRCLFRPRPRPTSYGAYLIAWIGITRGGGRI